MQQSRGVAQGSLGHGQVLAAGGILVVLALTAPLIGLAMLPVVALSGLARAFGSAAATSR